MATNERPEDDEDFVESCLIRWGLLGFVIGLAAIYSAMFALWRYALSIWS